MTSVTTTYEYGRGITFNLKLPKMSDVRICVQSPWFEEIVTGLKKVEGRLGNGTRYGKVSGKGVTLTRGGVWPWWSPEPPKKTLPAVITSIKHYPTLDAFLSGEGWQKVVPRAEALADARRLMLEIVTDQGHQVFSDDSVAAAGGIEALRLEI